MLANRVCKSYPFVVATLVGVGLSAPGVPAFADAGAPAGLPRPHAQLSGEVIERDHVTLMSGTLTEPSARAPREVSRDFLDDHRAMLGGAQPQDLSLARTTPLTRGHLLRYKQMHGGLEVIGSDTVVRLDDQGRVRWASSAARALDDGDVDLEPVVTGRDALALVGRHARYPEDVLAALDPAVATRLVIYAQPAMRAPRLAYRVELPFDMERLQRVRAYVDAETGLVYTSENLVRRQGQPTCPAGSLLANIYEENPVATPALSCVSLSSYLQAGATTLANADVSVTNCIDNRGCRRIGGDSYHFCDLAAQARADGGGNFTAYTFGDDLEPEDAFAEVQMFYHVNRAYEVARSLGGFDSTNARPLTAIVNFRAPSFGDASVCSGTSYGGNEALEPFDNALFVPRGALFGGDFPQDDAIIFGQGTGGDFSYDGDVVYHEFGHAVMATVSPDLSFYGLDSFGIHVLGGAMHEGYADLMTMFVTDDPEIGEYAIQGLTSSGATSIRDLNNDATCPRSLIGESHEDSLPFTGAMWEARQVVATTPAAKQSFDRAVFAAQQGFAAFETFETAAIKTLLELETSLGASARATAEAIFRDRGLVGDSAQGTPACNGRVVDGSAVQSLLIVPGRDKLLLDKLPAAVQFRYELPESASAIELDIGLSAADGPLFGPGEEQEPQMQLVANPGNTPVLWTLDQVGISGVYQHAADLAFTDVPDRPGLMSAKATLTGAFPAGVYHLQIVNQGPSWQLAQISLSHRTGALPGEEDDGGCGCTAGAAHDADSTRGMLAGLGLLLLAALALRGRRRQLARRP